MVSGEFIPTPPSPTWVKCTSEGHPYARVPEGNAYPTRTHLSELLVTPEEINIDLSQMALRLLDGHQKNKYVVPAVHINSVRRLGIFEGGYVNDEVITYVIKHQQKLFGLPELPTDVAIFG